MGAGGLGLGARAEFPAGAHNPERAIVVSRPFHRPRIQIPKGASLSQSQALQMICQPCVMLFVTNRAF